MGKFNAKFWLSILLFSVLYWVGWESNIWYSWALRTVFVGVILSYFRMAVLELYELSMETYFEFVDKIEEQP